ncbi:glycosyltransferase [Curtobacterium sp. MCBD17_021]|uniref:glycosyltransferase n=1 Tax=Curtobacterium sp. MCBD17_021 TaxID=2175665 RepID=UPI0015E8A48B|nr:glycosyltransferase [Curtobacterium sp. MCBD17_021]
MTYTEGGKKRLAGSLDGRSKPITAVGNSTDTTTLRAAADSLNEGDRTDARRLVGSGPRALFVGGLDESKKVHELLDSARHAHRSDPEFKLIVIGRGPLEDDVATAVAEGAVVWIESARGEKLAAFAALCESIWMPGRVGLVAVDALALGLPIVTVAHQHHAPELELLRADEVHFVEPDPLTFASAARNAAQKPYERRPSADLPSVQKVAARMRAVILSVAR